MIASASQRERRRRAQVYSGAREKISEFFDAGSFGWLALKRCTSHAIAPPNSAGGSKVASMTGRAPLMQGKRGLVMGLANARSLAWGIARACRGEGAELAFTYQGDPMKKRVEPLAAEIGGTVVGHCDV